MAKFVIVIAALVASACANGYGTQGYGNKANGYDALRIQYKPRAVVEYLPVYNVPSHDGYSGALQGGYGKAQGGYGDAHSGYGGNTGSQKVLEPSSAAASSAVASQKTGTYRKGY